MHALQDEMETIHLYVVRQEAKKPFTFLPLCAAVLCLVGIVALTLYSGAHPYYEHERLTIPAHFLPLKTFTAQAPIIPTGTQTYPATNAEGTLTIENGSVLSATLPAGMLFSATNGVEVQTKQAVYIPAGSATGYGVATVTARAVRAGIGGNIRALAVNAVYGTALYVRNLFPFSGGQEAYSVKVVLPTDRQTAITRARAAVSGQQAHKTAVLDEPCKEVIIGQSGGIALTVSCRYATYRVPSYMHVLSATLVGKNFLVTVAFIPPPRRFRIR